MYRNKFLAWVSILAVGVVASSSLARRVQPGSHSARNCLCDWVTNTVPCDLVPYWINAINGDSGTNYFEETPVTFPCGSSVLGHTQDLHNVGICVVDQYLGANSLGTLSHSYLDFDVEFHSVTGAAVVSFTGVIEMYGHTNYGQRACKCLTLPSGLWSWDRVSTVQTGQTFWRGFWGAACTSTAVNYSVTNNLVDQVPQCPELGAIGFCGDYVYTFDTNCTNCIELRDDCLTASASTNDCFLFVEDLTSNVLFYVDAACDACGTPSATNFYWSVQ